MDRETVASIGRWCDRTFGPGDPESPARSLRLLEEVVELCYADGAFGTTINARVQGTLRKCFLKHGDGADPGSVPEELADCFIVLATIAHQKGMDLDAEVSSKMKTNRERLWKVNGDGTGQHQ